MNFQVSDVSCFFFSDTKLPDHPGGTDTRAVTAESAERESRGATQRVQPGNNLLDRYFETQSWGLVLDVDTTVINV